MSTITNARDRPEKAEIQAIKQKIKKAINSNKTFLNFLKEKKIYGRYIKNTVNSLIQESYNINYVVEEVRQDFNSFTRAFTWAKTSEGYDFWKKYNLAYTIIKNKEKY